MAVRRGLTIPEILVAVALFLIAVLPLARVFSRGLRTVEQSENYLMALQLARQKADQVARWYQELHPGGVPLDFDGCAGLPFVVDYSTWPPTPTLTSRVRLPTAGGPEPGEPRPECPPPGTPPQVPAFPEQGVFYNDNVYIQLDASRLGSRTAESNESAVNAINEGLDQAQIALAVAAARIDPLDALAIYYDLPDLDPRARIDGVEDFGEIIDFNLLPDLALSVEQPGVPQCAPHQNPQKFHRWYEFGYRRIVCDPTNPTEPIPEGELVFAPRMICGSNPNIDCGTGGKLETLLQALDRARAPLQHFMRKTEVVSVFYMSTFDVELPGGFRPLDWWQYFFESTSPATWEETRWRNWRFGRLIRVTVAWKTGRKKRVPSWQNGAVRYVEVEEVRRVTVTRFVPIASPCDTLAPKSDSFWYLDPFTPHTGTPPGTLWHQGERLYIEYMGSDPALWDISVPGHWIGAQCGNP